MKFMRRKVIKVEKLKKITKKIIIYGLTLQLLLSTTSCGYKKNKVSNSVNTSYTVTEVQKDNSSNKPIPCNKREYNNFEFLSKGIDTNDSLMNVNSFNITYPYQELFNEEESVNNYINEYSTKEKHDDFLLSNNRISSSKLYMKVLENNNNYTNKTLKKELPNSDIEKICNYITEAINNEIEKGNIKDINELACVLSDLKIFEVNSMNEALVNGDRCLLVTKKMINNNAKKYKDVDYTKLIIEHEALHLCQISCKHIDQRIDHKYGFSEFRNTDEVNMYEYLWLSEANASIESANFQNIDPISYKSFVKYLNLIDFTNQMKNNKYKSLNDIALSKNINDLYEYFKANNEEEKREVDRFMFAIDIALNNNEKFFKHVPSNESTSELKQKMKISISEFLTKNFYKSLLSSLNNSNMKLNNIFYLINVFEANLNDIIYYSSESDYTNNKEFFEFYTNIQDEFFTSLAKSFNIGTEDIENYFKNYSLFKEDKKTLNYDDDFSDNYKNIINKNHTSSTYFNGNIRDYSEYYKGLYYIK